MELLGKHREIAAFGEMQLINDKIFRSFPKWIFECPLEHIDTLLNVYKQLCLTRFFRRRVWWQMNTPLRLMWQHFEVIWHTRFQSPQSFFWRNPVWTEIEKLWLSETVQGCIFGLRFPDDLKVQEELGLRGLYGFFSQTDIQQNFNNLVELKDAASLEEAYRTYGKFWSAVFSMYARKRDKTYWAEKTPTNVLYTPFFRHCFEDLKMINVIRDGRDVACSNVEEKWGAKNFKRALDMWATQLNNVLEDQKKAPQSQYINVRYEDLVLQTRSTLKRLTTFLQVDFDEAMMSEQVYSGSVGRYQDVWAAEMKAYARDRHGVLLSQWGYSV